MAGISQASPGHRCYSHFADGPGTYEGCVFRAFPEMFYSGALTAEQTDSMYTAGQGVTACPVGKWLTMGSPSIGGGSGLIFVHIPQGMPFGLLVHDMVERFLLYFFTQSAHSARPSPIPSLCTQFTRARIEWRRRHHAVCMARPLREPHHSGQAEP